MKIEKFTGQQRELFDQFEETQEKKKPLRGLGKEERVTFSTSFDTLLLFGILLVMVAILLYSTGVEIGRRHQRMVPVVAQQEAELKQTVPVPVTPVPTQEKKPVSPPAPAVKPAPRPAAKPATAPQPYTIQVLSYRQSAPAEEALGRLKKKGYPAFLLTTSSGVTVCVGQFTQASEAQPLLKELQKLYPDCFVRKK